MSNHNLTLADACKILDKSKRSIGRYIKQGKLKPQHSKSKMGTLEYRFSKEDLDNFLQADSPTPQPDTTEKKEQDKQDKTEQTDKQDTADKQDTQDKTDKQDGEVITLLKETTGLLKDQLTQKDSQIKDLSGKIDELIERDRETNILIGQLQSKVLMLEQPKDTIDGETSNETKPVKEKKGDKKDKPKKKKGLFKFFK